MSYPGTYASTDPDRPAVIMARSGQVRTFGELEARSSQFAQLMWAAGLRPGDHVAIFADNNIGYFDAFWGAMRSGLYFTTVNRYLTGEEAAYIVNDCGARVLVASPAVAEAATEMLPLIGDCDVRLMLDEVADGFDSFTDAIAAHPAEPLASQPRGSAMLYSSGTTGRPKGIMRPLDGTLITDPDLDRRRARRGHFRHRRPKHLPVARAAVPLGAVVVHDRHPVDGWHGGGHGSV